MLSVSPMHLEDLPVVTGKERRSQDRYAVSLELDCRRIGSEERVPGATTDMGRNGVRFQARQDFLVGARVELRIKWPTAVPFIALLMEGSVLRSGDGETAVRT